MSGIDATATANLASREQAKRARWQAAAWTAAIAGGFSAILAVLLAWHSVASRAADMRKADRLAELKQDLRRSPLDEALKERIRDLDRRLREDFFRHTYLTTSGRYLLLGGTVVLLIALKSAAALRRKLPMPRAAAGQPGAEARAARVARWAVVAACAVLVLAATALALSTPPPLAEKKEKAEVADFPSDEEVQRNWPRFRGPGGLAVAAFTNVPTSWNGKTNEGILWKSEVPLPAPSSPIVWGDRVFLTGSSKPSSPLLSAEDLKDAAGLVAKLRNPADPLSRFLRETFSPEAKDHLAKYEAGKPPSEELQGALADELNRAIQGDPFYDAQRFAGVQLSEKTRRLIEQKPRDKELVRLHRRLLEDAYPLEIAKQVEEKLEVYCFDATTGKLLWQQAVTDVPGSPAQKPKPMEGVGFAPSTPATDGRRVYAIFANGDLVAYDFQGGRVWARNLGVPENGYGHASSLAMWRNLLLVPYDQATADDKKSKLIAIEAASGKTVWEAKRDTPQTWATPIVATTEKGGQIIACGDPYLCGYDPATGKELWRAECLGGEVVPSPAYANGVAFAANAGSYATAVRTDGQGDVTKTHILWKAEDGLPDICSPLTNGELVFLLASDGLLTCYDAKSGKRVWEHELRAHSESSPSLVGDKVYILTDAGTMIIVHAGREFKEVGRAELGEKSSRAIPAFLDGRIIIRGEKHLFCIGKK